ncbi:MAG: rhomboid family intramembrane serine protease [Bacteroidetes bacterium]|nr:rhomboid family intramembrane serine protease [Bacteroidota bacterium]
MDHQKNTFSQSAFFPLLFLLLLWVVFFFDQKYQWHLNEYGLKPQQIQAWYGIFTMPLLHADIGHLASNSVPLLVLGICLFYFYPETALKIFFLSYIWVGLLLWLLVPNPQKNEVHIGASGLVYALAGFLIASGIIRKNKALFGISLLVVFLYGTIIWGVLPGALQKAIHYIEDGAQVSWQGHLFGLSTGVLLAFVYKKTGAQKPHYSWELPNDEELDESNPYWLEDESPESHNPEQKKEEENPTRIHYTYIPKEEKKE